VTVAPVPVIAPTLLLPLRTPSTVQARPVLEVPLTVAANCCVAFVSMLDLLGLMLTLTAVTVTAALADFVVSATLVAVTV
jgi:hypothetical protein